MQLAFITALGVGGATIIGVLLGFLFQKIPHEFNDVVLGHVCRGRDRTHHTVAK